MFYTRINKLKIFDNRERGFLGLFDRAEIRIYGYATGYFNAAAAATTPLTLGDLADLPDDEARKKRLLEAVISEADRFSQSLYMEVNGVKDNQTLTFSESGLVLYQCEKIPDRLDIQLWVIESDSDIRNFAIDADKVLDSEAFNSLLAAVGVALAVTNPVLTAIVGVGKVLTGILRKKLRSNKDDLVGYLQCSLTREEHYPHGTRDRQDVPDTTGNVLVDYTLFGVD